MIRPFDTSPILTGFLFPKNQHCDQNQTLLQFIQIKPLYKSAMQIAIISDVHNNEINLEKVLRYCAEHKIEKIVCCGDLASKEVLDLMNDIFAGVIYYTFGNADYTELRELDALEKYRNTNLFKNFGETKIGDKQIAFVHFPQVAKKLAKTGKYAFVFHGHTHKPWVSSAEASADQGSNKCTILNPGNVAGEIYPPTFAVWDTENDGFKLIRVHDLR